MSERKECLVCGEVNDLPFWACRNCATPLNITKEEAERLKKKPDITPINCLRCNTQMTYAGLKRFHEGPTAWGFWLGDLGELFTKREYYDVYLCKSCGKIELFLDGIGDNLRSKSKEPV